MELKILGQVRGVSPGNFPEGREDQQLVLNSRGEQVVAQGLPELTELVRLGQSWAIASTTGQAALLALPTVTAGLTIVNGEPANGLSLAIDSFGSWEAVVDATQTDVTALFAMLNKQGDSAPSSGTAETGFTSLSGRKALDAAVSAIRGATVINNNWFPHSTEGAQMAAAAAGAQWKVNEARVRGLYFVRPGSAFSIQAVKAAAAAAAQQFFFIRFHCVQILWKS